jgi:hypothetical protein
MSLPRKSAQEGTLRLKQRYLISAREGLIMTNRRRSPTARSVPAQTPVQLLALSQEYIRPLIGMIDRLNEAGAEDELRVITKQLTQLVFRPQPFPQRQVTPRAARHADRKSRLEFCPAV